MKITQTIMCMLVLFLSTLLSLKAQDKQELAQKLQWIQEKIEQTNLKAEYINLGFEYELEKGKCTYTFAQNPYGNEESIERIYTFLLTDIGEVALAKQGVILKTKEDAPLIEVKIINRYPDNPQIKKDKVAHLDINAEVETQRLQLVFRECIKLYN